MRTIPGIVTHTVTDAPHRNRQNRVPNWLKAVYAVVAGIVVIVALSLTLGPAGDSLPPCKSEDGTHCYWDADTMGNGIGHDVVNR